MSYLFTGIDQRQPAQYEAENAAFREALADIARSYPAQISVPWCQERAKRALDQFEDIPAVVAYGKPL